MVFALMLPVSFVILLIPTGFFAFIVFVNSVPPESYVETDIVIEENGYQAYSFTADGVVYEALELKVYDLENIGEPVFSYKTKGLLNGSQCGNYYEVESAQGFTLVCGGAGRLFAPVEKKETIKAYYEDIENLCGYYEAGRAIEGTKLPDAENAAFKKLLNTDLTELSQEQKILSRDETEEFEIAVVCNDGLVFVESYCFVIVEDTLYYECDYEYIGEESDEDHYRYTLIKIPNDVAEPLLALHEAKGNE